MRDEGFKVVLTGEGADEVFGGYDIFKEAKLRRFCAAQPRLAPPAAALSASSTRICRSCRRSRRPISKAFFATDLDATADPLFSHLPRFRTTAGAKLVLLRRPERRRSPATTRSTISARSLPGDFARWHPLSQAQYLETAHLLPGYILSSQGDRVAMAHAVEGRFPFLDHRVVEIAARIPPTLKLRGLTREAHPARGDARIWCRRRSASAHQAALPRAGQPSFFGRRAPAYVAERLVRPRSPRAACSTRARSGSSPPRRAPGERRLPRQHGAHRHPLDPALAADSFPRRHAAAPPRPPPSRVAPI